VNYQSTKENEDSPKNYCSKNTPKQYTVIVFFLNLKVFKYEQYYENIVNRQGVFCQVGWEVFYGMIRSIIPVNKEAEKGAYQDPKGRLIKRWLCSDLMRLFMKQAQIKNEKDQNDNGENSKKDSLPIIIIPEKGE